ncbi:uncharacterized protein PGTG_08657 [Puccinia graminis f. sp. tritici CRL 75-36-700-3]|uniref:Tc1-like transposase DDE domain-containing protein n=1 Tax=Puccinia graminis f. sp. tritici (strain CRL 75-36-700-3 / race SCCL) TaxID=418459 RepID=E3KGP6_PUCGT|nr:uncharacterized protein PGTG_08657 [Puccinia graminis f. sp. tritici CRL 75-36-700-3]EFP83471.1 hypothetical protein PGTG_08657 [Puccinia graminis f. sp. tritici CRL 75-36-700-3]
MILDLDLEQKPTFIEVWCCKRVWAQAPVPRVLAPPGPAPAPRGLDLAGRVGVGPWHWPKPGLAEPKLWAHQITDIDYHHHFTSMSESVVMDPTDLEIQANKERTRALEAIKKAKSNIDENRTYKNDRLTHKERKPNAIIKPEVRDLIRENVNGKGMKIGDAMKKFNVSRRQIQRIKGEDPNLIRTHKKRPGKFTDDMKTELLMQLDQKLTTTLAEMAAFIKDRFDVKVSTQAISNLIHDMDISWKQVTNIPAAWNKPDLIEQRANFVNRRGLDLGRRVVFVDEAGFDLHSSRAFGYAPSSQPAVLSLVPKAKQITLIGALSVEGFDYYELLNANNTKAKGVGADEFCLFLGSLGACLPNEAIIIMDNAPIHQGDRFEEVIKSLDASKSIKVEFLPPYSPFLNPIEYSFHSIKSYVRSKEPPNRMALVDEIKKGIQESITPEKSQHFFAHCQRLYRPCADFQQITGPVLSSSSA